MNNLLDNIRERKDKLEELRALLKKKFFGIDNEIDKIVESITTWYSMPDIITHPIIVNLWSLTGNGKTDLVRTLVDFLGFNNHFCEIQLSDTGSGDKKKDNISSMVLSSGCRENEPGIILLDEFQRYRTKDAMGMDVKGLPYQDIWLLLSDGKFPVDDKKSTEYHKLCKALGNEWKFVEYDDDGNLVETKMDQEEYEHYVMRDTRYKVKKPAKSRAEYLFLTRTTDKNFCAYDDSLIESIQLFLDYTMTIDEISNATYLEMLAKIQEYHKNRTSTYNFVKCLIFVCGNLDEAFQVSGDVENCDTDADIFHKYTKKVSIIEIKQALGTRFKPEQISRLGNNHVIYPSLNKEAYKNIIRRTCNNYIVKASEISKVQFKLHESVVDEIYANAVYPTQGTRPVFSSIHMMFGAPLSNGILWALENHYDELTIKVMFEESCLTFFSECGQKLCVPIQLQLRERRNRNSLNFSTLVSVHEIGHAILYTHLFKDAPSDIKINVASFDGGYNQYDFKYSCAKDVLDQICVGLGGIIAEEIIFGSESRSTGSASDISKCTSLASQYVRRWAMAGSLAKVEKDQHTVFAQDSDDSDKRIEEIMNTQKTRGREIMDKYVPFLISCSKDLLKTKGFNKAEFREYAKNVFDFSNVVDDNSNKVDTNAKYHDMLMAN